MKMFKMVFVINNSLKMMPGKIASQTAHSAVSLYIKAKSDPKKFMPLFDEIDVWIKNGQTKVVLKGRDDEHLFELEQRAKEQNLLTEFIRDAGRTQIRPNSLTCLGIFGKIDLVDKVTGNLTLL